MEQDKMSKCIACKRSLPATDEYFDKIKKGKNGLGNVCKDCKEDQKSCGIGSKWRKSAAGKYYKPVSENRLNNMPGNSARI